MATLVTAAEPKHAEAIATLAEEMNLFYRATQAEPLDVRLQQINEALFDDPPVAYALLAWHADRAVGFASYSFLWPAVGLTRSLYLKELYVPEAARRSGVGRALMRSLFETANACGCTAELAETRASAQNRRQSSARRASRRRIGGGTSRDARFGAKRARTTQAGPNPDAQADRRDSRC
ncbi:MAG: GNAT family N-acetyltransferase, partial [bacterium]|nr:GNAT family N-acetyltransferase [bacterium]